MASKNREIEYSLEEVNILYKRILVLLKDLKVLRDSQRIHLNSVENFHNFIRGEDWIRYLIYMPFEDLPKHLTNRDEGVSDNWHRLIVTWRLELGK
jgi:hypothetical protein